jgi:AAHS family 4-hydroxybenzoate transporter-like MFS transporter
MPNIIALTAEYSPVRNRALLISLMLCGLPLGGALGGQLAAELIADFGWQSVFIVGGIVPLVLFAVAFLLLPESIKFLAGRGSRRVELLGILARIRPELPIAEDAAEFRAERETAAPIGGLFRDGRAAGTLLLWTIFFLNLFSMYFLASWLPTVLRAADWSARESLIGTSVYHYGGLAGGLLFSHLIDRLHSFRILPPVYLATLAAIAAIGALVASVPAAFLVLALAGAGLIGAQFCLNALAAAFYPTVMRATGVGWALGIGRLGAIVSPLIAGAILAAAWPVAGFFAAAALPLLVCAGAVALLARNAAAR